MNEAPLELVVSNPDKIGLCSTCLRGMKAPANAPACPTPGKQIADEGCAKWKRLPEKQQTTELVKPAAKVPTLQTGDDAEVAKRFVDLYQGAANGMRRVVAFGLYAWHIKLNCLKHSQFGPWAEAIAEQHGIKYRSVRSYMHLTESVLKHCGIKQIKPFIAQFRNQIGKALPISHCGEFLLLPDTEVPTEFKVLREEICSTIDGKSAYQLFWEFKQSDEEEDRPKRGRPRGKGGNSKAVRDAAKARLSQAQIAALEQKAKHVTHWMTENGDAERLGKIDNAVFDSLYEAVRTLSAWMTDVRKARGQKGAGL